MMISFTCQPVFILGAAGHSVDVVNAIRWLHKKETNGPKRGVSPRSAACPVWLSSCPTAPLQHTPPDVCCKNRLGSPTAAYTKPHPKFFHLY